MVTPIDVFFEFGSPYSYLANQELPALAAHHGRQLRWRPIELAKVWAAQGVLEAYAAVRRVKLDYVRRDAARPRPAFRSAWIAPGYDSRASRGPPAKPTRARGGRAFRAWSLAQALGRRSRYRIDRSALARRGSATAHRNSGGASGPSSR
jgi:hypothetical protein